LINKIKLGKIMIKFNILNSINKLVPGARFKGAIKLHTEEEYNDLE